MCGCGKASAPQKGTTAAAASTSPTGPPPETAPLKYRGARALLVRGPTTGAGYACYPGAIIRANVRDVPGLVASGAFVRHAE